MKIFKVTPRGMGANGYVLTADGKTAVVIDPFGRTILAKVVEQGLTVEYVLLTHCHFDHVETCELLQKEGAKIVCLDKEKPNFGTFADLHKLFHAPEPNFTIDETVTDGETRTFCGIDVKVVATAGHTSGSVTYVVEDFGTTHLFTGDTLFQGSVGRTDFPTGYMPDLAKSLKKLSKYDGVIHAGHGEDTTMEREIAENPYMR